MLNKRPSQHHIRFSSLLASFVFQRSITRPSVACCVLDIKQTQMKIKDEYEILFMQVPRLNRPVPARPTVGA
jgi:hypothetical protein